MGGIDLDLQGHLAISIHKTAFNVALIHWSKPAKGCYTSQTCSCLFLSISPSVFSSAGVQNKKQWVYNITWICCVFVNLATGTSRDADGGAVLLNSARRLGRKGTKGPRKPRKGIQRPYRGLCACLCKYHPQSPATTPGCSARPPLDCCCHGHGQFHWNTSNLEFKISFPFCTSCLKMRFS